MTVSVLVGDPEHRFSRDAAKNIKRPDDCIIYVVACVKLTKNEAVGV